ncbi:SdpI family protein [Lentilactobacillus parakefiri]|uniref:SdpI family protein n=1 Tax=Lentilactobacillus parakefiri TaxID=152332 RepID=A0A269YGD2_9LACO|nr:SdpI family protein [Lentilactobacillus parakefiri]PAK84592.1 hypothetical protein B8W98_04945 [Lentilactobacillus parakefiri]PAL00016.1 hypothetical protein B8W96_08710 [Lentilactobacillus parakefiri]TDG88963.1 hypothetical protein C5L28_000785 [Lentilactobacillus parakefiri]GAW72922.1 hypothetical protein LPKJCM_02055 [Lentilactobacillus parakefiri]
MGIEFAGLILLIFIGAAIYYYFGSREPSRIVGYRTPQSRSTKEKWQASQKWFYSWGIACQVVLVVINLFVSLSITSNVVILLVYILLISWVIESRLRKMDH